MPFYTGEGGCPLWMAWVRTFPKRLGNERGDYRRKTKPSMSGCNSISLFFVVVSDSRHETSLASRKANRQAEGDSRNGLIVVFGFLFEVCAQCGQHFDTDPRIPALTFGGCDRNIKLDV